MGALDLGHLFLLACHGRSAEGARATLVVHWSRILPLCACGARAAPAVARAATLGRSIAGAILPSPASPRCRRSGVARGVRSKSDPLAIGTACVLRSPCAQPHLPTGGPT